MHPLRCGSCSRQRRQRTSGPGSTRNTMGSASIRRPHVRHPTSFHCSGSVMVTGMRAGCLADETMTSSLGGILDGDEQLREVVQGGDRVDQGGAEHPGGQRQHAERGERGYAPPQLLIPLPDQVSVATRGETAVDPLALAGAGAVVHPPPPLAEEAGWVAVAVQDGLLL